MCGGRAAAYRKETCGRLVAVHRDGGRGVKRVEHLSSEGIPL